MRNSFSLDGVRVEHRALPREAFRVSLPLPVAADAMYAALPGRGRFATPDYAEWLERAGMRLAAAAAPRFKGAVWIAIIYEADAALDNCARPVLELLLSHGVIARRGLVKELRLGHGPVSGARVEVRPFAFDARP
jgi:hypothetical protein